MNTPISLGSHTGENIAIHRNISRERCLVCCDKESFTHEHAAILISLGYEVQTASTSGEALRRFMAVKPNLLIVHHSFLPSFPHRLIQLFKMAHCAPATLLLAPNVLQVWGYLHLKHEGYFEFLETPLRPEELAYGVKLTSQRQKNTRRKLFVKDLLTQAALALPVFAFLAYLTVKYYS